MMNKVACVHCGQDWVQAYKRMDTGQKFFMCPECESVWLHEECIEEETEVYLSEYMMTGDSVKDWESIMPVD